MNHIFKKLGTAAAIAAIGFSGAASAAGIFQDFKVDETAVYSAANGNSNAATTALEAVIAQNFTADKVTGSYAEIFTVTGPTTFATSAYANLTGFSSAGGTVGVSPAGIGALYGLYATFTATGNILGAGTSFAGTSGEVKLYLDPFLGVGGAVTTKTLPGVGGGAVVLGNDADDILIASTSSFTSGEGHNFPGSLGGANGDFSLIFDQFLLTTAGAAYFYDPDPFHLRLVLDGNFGSFAIPNVNGSAIITGAANAFFALPEPSTLALAGIALLGFAGASRRRSS